MKTMIMKTSKLMILGLALLGLAVTGQGQIYTQTKIFTNSESGVVPYTGPIPDANPVGLVRPLEVSGMAIEGEIAKVQVSLKLDGGYNGDLYGYLSYNGQKAVLLNRVGVSSTSEFGYGVAGMDVTFADGEPDIHWAVGGSPLTGTWQPDGRDISPMSAGAYFDSTTPTLLLGVFNGMLDPNGMWTLFLADASGGDVTTFTEWTLEISMVPEPGTGLLLGLGLLGLAVWKRNRRSTGTDVN